MARLRSIGTNQRGRRLTVAQAADRNDRRELFVALRGRIARAFEASDLHPRDLAALSRRLWEIARELEALDVQGEKSDPVGAAGKVPDAPWTTDDV